MKEIKAEEYNEKESISLFRIEQRGNQLYLSWSVADTEGGEKGRMSIKDAIESPPWFDIVSLLNNALKNAKLTDHQRKQLQELREKYPWQRLQCPHCEYEWNYVGNAKENDFVACPNCGYKRKLKNYSRI